MAMAVCFCLAPAGSLAIRLLVYVSRKNAAYKNT